MPLPDFHSSEPYTLGIELELQVVNPPGYDLSGTPPPLSLPSKTTSKVGK